MPDRVFTGTSSKQYDDPISETPRRQRGDEIHRLIADPAPSLHRCAQKAVEEHSGESGRHRNPYLRLTKQSRPPPPPPQSPDRPPAPPMLPEMRDAAVGPRRDALPGRDHSRISLSRYAQSRSPPCRSRLRPEPRPPQPARPIPSGAKNRTRQPLRPPDWPAPATHSGLRAARPRPSASLRRYPRRVETQVITNSAASVANAPGPPPAKSRKQARPPATAPDRFTPRKIRASTANPSGHRSRDRQSFRRGRPAVCRKGSALIR